MKSSTTCNNPPNNTKAAGATPAAKGMCFMDSFDSTAAPKLTAAQRREIAQREERRRKWEQAEKSHARRIYRLMRIHDERSARRAMMADEDPYERRLVQAYRRVLALIRQRAAKAAVSNAAR